MVAAPTLRSRPRSDRTGVARRFHRLRRPRIAPTALLAWLGLTVTLLWPGPWFTPMQIALLLASQMPLGLSILTRLEAELEQPATAPAIAPANTSAIAPTPTD